MSHARIVRRINTVIGGGALAASSLCLAQPPCEVVELTPIDGQPADLFGSNVGLTGDLMAIGSSSDTNPYGTYAGAVYLYRFDGSTWNFEKKFFAPDGADYDHFSGGNVTMGPPERLLAWALWDDDNGDGSGSAHVFRRDGTVWVHEQKLLPSDGLPYDNFGGGQITQGPPWRIAIGVRAHDHDGVANCGSVYVFRLESDPPQWVEEQEFLPDDSQENQTFGHNVSISGGEPWRIAAGGHRDDNENGVNAGAAYVFLYDSDTSQWVQHQKLLPDDGEDFDRFGRFISMSGDTIMAGSNWDNDNGEAAGAVYVFRLNPETSYWEQKQKLFPHDPVPDHHFGKGVHVRGDTAIIGAPGPEYNDYTPGSTYVFRYYHELSLWVEDAKIVPTNVVLGGGFGAGKVEGETAAIGAWFDNDNGVHSGSAHVYDLAKTGDLDCDGEVGVLDFLSLLAEWGPCPDPCPPSCAADLDGDCAVGVIDFLALLADWG
jgi:hypothetical protein